MESMQAQIKFGQKRIYSILITVRTHPLIYLPIILKRNGAVRIADGIVNFESFSIVKSARNNTIFNISSFQAHPDVFNGLRSGNWRRERRGR